MQIQAWYSPRRKRFWALALAALYTVFGFVVVPWLIERELPGIIQENLHRPATIQKAHFNPWTLQLELEQVALNDNQGEPIFGFDQLIVNVQTRSIIDFALDFGEISLHQPKIYITRYAFADSNVGRMLNDMEAADATTPPTATDSDAATEPLRLVIDKLEIVDGALFLQDAMPATPFNTTLNPINISVLDLSTLPDRIGNQQVSITTETGAELTWTGELELNPLVSAGTLTISGSPSGVLYRYFQDQLNFTLEQCCLDLAFDYQAKSETDGNLSADISNLEISLRDLILHTKTGEEQIVALPEIALHGGSLAWPEQIVSAEQIVFAEPSLNVWLNEDGTLNLNQLLVEDSSPAEDSNQDEDSAASQEEADAEWDISLGELLFAGLSIELEDRSLTEAAKLVLPNTNLSIRKIGNQPDSVSPLSLDVAFAEAGSLKLEGELGLAPQLELQSKLEIDRLALAMLQPWVAESAQVLISDGQLNVSGSLSSGPEEGLGLLADISIDALNVSDTRRNEPLVGWKQLRLEETRVQLDAQELEISKIVLAEPFARIAFAEDGTSNFEALADKEAAEEPPVEAESLDATNAEGSSEENFAVRVGQTLIEDASVDFSDRSLPLPFRVLIKDFGGTISALATDSTQPSDIDLQGQVGEFGLAEINGALSVMAPTEQADVGVRFKNLSMPDLSGYSAEFAGRKIESGKLDLNLDYKFSEGQMQGDNQVVLSDFRLGETVESPDAVNLPLDLALALLRDRNGVINIDLAVAGDVNDPSFNAGGLLLKTFSNLITKAATAPFALLGKLVPGGGGESFDLVAFKPGNAELAPPEREKLSQLAAALQERPTLTLQAPGGYDEVADKTGLQAAQLDSEVAMLIGSASNAAADGQLTARTRAALERLGDQQLPDFSARELAKNYTNEGDGLDELAYMADLRGQLEQAQIISTEQLAQLGDARRSAIITELTENLGLNKGRVSMANTSEAQLNDEGLVLLEMTLSVDDGQPAEVAADQSAAKPDAP